jgi:hypothetical protein
VQMEANIQSMLHFFEGTMLPSFDRKKQLVLELQEYEHQEAALSVEHAEIKVRIGGGVLHSFTWSFGLLHCAARIGKTMTPAGS